MQINLDLTGLIELMEKAKAFPLKESVAAITEVLPGANCGGCGYAGCAQLAQAILI